MTPFTSDATVRDSVPPRSQRASQQFRGRYYERLVSRLRHVVDLSVPEGSTILVVSRGDPKLLKMPSCHGMHFPQADNGAYAGHHPANSKSAIAHLEDLRGHGAEFILFPATSLWWLEYYAEFSAHLGQHYRLLSAVADEHALFDLRKARRSHRRARLPASDVLSTGDTGPPDAYPELARVVDDRYSLLGWFDPEFYKARYPDLHGDPAELLRHYLTYGWQEERDPCSWFSSGYYLARYEDVRTSGLNPFVHYIKYGRAEGRLPNDYHAVVRSRELRPSVSVIVPNYNHERFLEQRLSSIASQSYKPAELIVLDDASTDASRDTIASLIKDMPFPVTTRFNSSRSGNVFRQWRKGVTSAQGDLVWICESDDFCEPDFLSHLVPHFGDPSVMLAFGRVQFATADGEVDPWLDEYREQARPGYWADAHVESAYSWFQGAFGLANVIPNVGGCLFRRQALPSPVWRAAQRFSVCGDWYLYMHLAGGGRIAYEPQAIAYFRQHGANTSVASFTDVRYYREHALILEALRRRYGLDDEGAWRFYQRVREHFFRHFAEEEAPVLRRKVPFQRLLDQRRTVRHILIGILGFRTGGGEIFPIHLANALRARGHHVSLLVLESEDAISDIKGLLDAGIPVYERAAVEAFGPGFFASHQFDLVHTHYQGVDRWIADACRTQGVPYVVTLHGSHEVADCDDAFLTGLRRSVDHWVYTADKNLTIFGRIGRPSAPVTKIRNAVPEDPTRFPRRRGELAPEQDAVLFGLASRALRAKGWEIAIAALAALRAEVTRPVHLALCGDGDEYEELFDLYADAPGVHFLGYQHAITGFYSLCDCCVLPTRFSGESFPFTLIEALKAGTPIIATDIGEIRNIVQPSPADTAGLLVPLLPDDKALTRAVAAAMATALNDDQRRAWAKAATRLGKDYLFDRLTSEYEGVYEAVLRGGA